MNVETRSIWRSGRATILLLAVFGSIFSAWAQPANDSFIDASVITGGNGSASGDNFDSTGEPGEPSHAGRSFGNSVWFKWIAPADGLVILDTIGSDFDTILAVYTGTDVAALQGIVGNDDADPNVYGPSAVKFYAQTGIEYMVVVDGFFGSEGNYFLNWAYRSAGKFQFTKNTYSFSENESASIRHGSVSPTESGALITVNRLFGATGRVLVDYEAISGPSEDGFTDYGIAEPYVDYLPITGTLVFNDQQMSASLRVPIFRDAGDPETETAPRDPRNFTVLLSNARFNVSETVTNDIAPPMVNPGLSNATINILDIDVNVKDGDYTNAVFNFERSYFRTPESGNGWGFARIYVTRTGTNNAACSVSYRINFLTGAGNDRYHTYDVQAGSDYVLPRTDDPEKSDYDPVTGTLSWAQNDFVPKFFDVPLVNDETIEFNEDMLLQLHDPSSGGALGNVNTATLTVLFDDQPAGAVDRTYNKDNAFDTTPPFNQKPGANGTVYAVLMQADDKAIVVGDFTSYNTIGRNRIALVDTNGQLDVSFNPGSGADNFITSVALDSTNRIVIGGGFTSYRGVQRYGVARLNGDGSLDTTFTPGLGADGTVWAVLARTNGIYIAGDFTSVNGVARKHVARLNLDGSVDMTFDTGNGPDGSVFAIALQEDEKLVIGGEFTTVGGFSRHGVARLNADGSFDDSYDSGSGTDGAVYAMALQPDGKVVIGGAFKHINLFDQSGLSRLDTNGLVDTTFDIGIGTDDPVYAVTLQPNGKIFIGGFFTSINGSRRVGIARLLPEGYVDTTFMDTAYNQFAGLVNTNASDPGNFVFGIGVQSDGGVIIAGGFDRIGGGSSRTDSRIRRNVARLVGGETVGSGYIGFTSPVYGADEASRVFIQIVRTNGYLGPASAAFTPQFSATGGAEYRNDFIFDASVYGNPTYQTSWSGSQMRGDGFWGFSNDHESVVTNFNGGVTRWVIRGGLASIYVDIVDDSLIEGDESLDLRLSIPNGTDIFFLGGENIPLSTALGRSRATLTVADNDALPGVLSFRTDNFTISEDASSAVVWVTRTEGSYGTIQVNYTLSNVTATAGSDYTLPYTGTSGTLTFASGVTSNKITIPIANDTAVEPDETVLLRLFGPTRGATLGMSNSVLTIIDNDFTAGRVNFNPAVYNVAENIRLATVTVTRTGGSTNDLSVQFIASNLVASATNALAGSDYVATNGVLYWVSGDSLPKTFTVNLLDDGVVENTEKIDLRLFNASTGTNSLGNTITGIINIIDEDRYGSFSFNTTNYYTTDDGGVLDLIVVRNGGIAGTATVNYTVTEGTAINGSHFFLANGTLTFPPGVSSTNVVVSILPQVDPPYANREFAVTLSSATPAGANGATVGSPDSTIVTIVDHHLYNESAGSVDTSFNPIPGANNYIYNLALQPDGKILAAGDFTQLNGFSRNRIGRFETNGALDIKFSSATLGANSTIRSVALAADGRILIGGNFTEVNSTPRNSIARLNSDGLLDTSFNPGSGADSPIYSVVEALAGTERKVYIAGSFSTFNGTARNGIARLNTNGTVDVVFTPSHGANGTVYTLLPYPTNSVNAGKLLIGGDFTTFNGSNCSRIARLNADGSLDTTFDPGVAANNSVRAIALQADGNILVGGLFTNFNGVAFNHIARLTPSGAIDTTFNVAPGANDSVYTITLQTDGKILLGGEFTTANGVTRSRLTRLTASGAVDPTINFGSGADGFISAIAVQPNGKILIAGGFATFDDVSRPYIARIHGGSLAGPGTLQFTSGTYRVLESTNAFISIRRRGGTSQTPAGPVTVQFDTIEIPGQAIASTDFAAIHTNIFFPVGETLKTIVVPIINDNIVSGDLSIALTLGSATGEAIVTNQPSATLTILNDDSELSLSLATYRRPENAINGAATIEVFRSGSLVNTASVSFVTTTLGTASPGLDFNLVSTNLIFLPGESNKTVFVPLLNDTLIEGDETVLMGLSGFAGTFAGSVTNAVLTIVDDDFGPGVISFIQPSYIIGESSNSLVVTFIRTNGITGVVSVNYVTSDISASGGVDYKPAAGTILFADTETTKSITLEIYDDKIVEPNESFGLSIFNPGGGAAIAGVTNVTITIGDDEFTAGSLDTSFNPGTGASSWIRSLGLQPDGKILIGGAFTSFNGTNRNYVARLLSSGALDPSFNPGSGANAVVSTVSLMSDERIAVAGAFTNVNGVNFNRAGRLFNGGGADTNFNQPTGLNAAVNSLAVQPDNKVLVGGGFTLPTAGISRLQPNGSLDATFSIGSGVNGTVHSVVLQTTNASGSAFPLGVVFGGDFSMVSGASYSKVCRIHMDGLIDQTFSPPLITTGRVYAVAVQYDGKIVMGGDFIVTTTSGTNATTYQRIARLNVDGSLDSTFNAGTGANDTIYALALQLDGKIYIGGDFTSVNSISRNRIARLNQNGSFDTSFDPGSGADSTIYAVAVLPDQKILIAGDFTTVNGFFRKGIARLNADDLRPVITGVPQIVSGQVQLTFESVPGYTYALEASLDLVTWTEIARNTASADPATGTSLTLMDNSIGNSRQFYRIQQIVP